MRFLLKWTFSKSQGEKHGLVDIAVETLTEISESGRKENLPEILHDDIEKQWNEIFGGWA